MGDKSTSCNKDTNNALIECAYFNPESIIGKALKYDLNSDASYKFERGVNPEFLNIAIRRFIKIVSDHANISKINIYEKSYEDLIKKVIDFDVSIINKILGVNISEGHYTNYIEMLGFAVTKDKKIIVPFHRHDIKHQNDMAEEVARIIGYNNIEIKDFIPLDKDKLPEPLTADESIKNFLIKNGFSEVINAPFTKHGLLMDYDVYGAPLAMVLMHAQPRQLKSLLVQQKWLMAFQLIQGKIVQYTLNLEKHVMELE